MRVLSREVEARMGLSREGAWLYVLCVRRCLCPLPAVQIYYAQDIGIENEGGELGSFVSISRRWESNSHRSDWREIKFISIKLREFDSHWFNSMRIRLSSIQIDRNSILIYKIVGNLKNLYWNFKKCQKTLQIKLNF